MKPFLISSTTITKETTKERKTQQSKVTPLRKSNYPHESGCISSNLVWRNKLPQFLTRRLLAKCSRERIKDLPHGTFDRSSTLSSAPFLKAVVVKIVPASPVTPQSVTRTIKILVADRAAPIERLTNDHSASSMYWITSRRMRPTNRLLVSWLRLDSRQWITNRRKNSSRYLLN